MTEQGEPRQEEPNGFERVAPPTLDALRQVERGRRRFNAMVNGHNRKPALPFKKGLSGSARAWTDTWGKLKEPCCNLLSFSLEDAVVCFSSCEACKLTKAASCIL